MRKIHFFSIVILCLMFGNLSFPDECYAKITKICASPAPTLEINGNWVLSSNGLVFNGTITVVQAYGDVSPASENEDKLELADTVALTDKPGYTNRGEFCGTLWTWLPTSITLNQSQTQIFGPTNSNGGYLNKGTPGGYYLARGKCPEGL